MQTTTSISLPHAPARPTTELTVGDVFDEVLPIVGVVFVAGPPVLVSGALLALLALMVIGALTLIVTLAAVVAAVASLAGLAGAAVAVPYRVLRRRRDGLAALPAPEQLPPTPIAAHWTAAWRAPDQALPSAGVLARA